MKTMQNFAAQQLSKKQMNEVKGGTVHIRCAIVNSKDDMVAISKVEGSNLKEALDNLNSTVYDGERATDCEVWES